MKTLPPPLRLARRKHYTVAGRSICLEAEEESALRPFEHIYAGWHLRPLTPDPAAPPDVTIRVREGAPPPLPDASPESFETAPGWVCRADENSYSQESEGCAVRARADEPRAVEVWLDADAVARPWPALARLVLEATCVAWRRCGLYSLHAAACVEPRSGACVLFAGPSGSGKSTLTTQLAARGWPYISDDSLLLAESAGRVEAWGVRRSFAMTKDSFDAGRVPALNEVATYFAPFDPHKLRFQPQEAFPEGFAESGTPRVLFFVSLSHERESRCRELSQQKAMARLLRQCPWACYDVMAARGYFSALAALSRQCSSYELRAGTDLLGELDFTAAYVAAYAGARI